MTRARQTTLEGQIARDRLREAAAALDPANVARVAADLNEAAAAVLRAAPALKPFAANPQTARFLRLAGSAEVQVGEGGDVHRLTALARAVRQVLRAGAPTDQGGAPL